METNVWSDSNPGLHFPENGTTSESDSAFSVPSTPRFWGAKYPITLPTKQGSGYLTPPFLVNPPPTGPRRSWSRSMSAGNVNRPDNALIANVIARLRTKSMDHRNVDVFGDDDQSTLLNETDSMYSADISQSASSSQPHSRSQSIASRVSGGVRSGHHASHLVKSHLPAKWHEDFTFREEMPGSEANDGEHGGSNADYAGGDVHIADAGSGQKRGRPRSGNVNSTSQEANNDPQTKRGRFDVDDDAEDKANRRWACPYQKFDPIGEPSCGHPKPNNLHGGFDNLSRLKTHLKECHDPVMRCTNCWLSFKSISKGDQERRHEQFALHLQQANCAHRKPPRKYWMTEEQRTELNVTQYGSDVDRWYRFLKLLLPGMTDEEMRTRYKPWYVPPAPQVQEPFAVPQRRPETPESAGSEGDAASSSLVTPLPRAPPLQTPVEALLGDPNLPLGPDPFLSSMAVNGMGMDMTGLGGGGGGGDVTTLFGFGGGGGAAFTTTPVEARLQMDAFSGAATPAIQTVLRPRPGHLQPDVQMLRQKNRRLVDVVSRTRGDVAEVEDLLAKVLCIADGDVREGVEKAVLLLSDVQCRLDDC